MGDVAAVPIEESVQFEQEMALLQQALSSMDADQRLLIQLRYQEGLTLREIARLLGYEDPFRARRAIEKALRALRGLIEL